ncbi:hypothetical protein OIO90_002052 [Microbotryomycetes sp. JL221]|nr:hypothetical protein OIO90_002052 [Microbotryomycetes sp. JL221]
MDSAPHLLMEFARAGVESPKSTALEYLSSSAGPSPSTYQDNRAYDQPRQTTHKATDAATAAQKAQHPQDDVQSRTKRRRVTTDAVTSSYPLPQQQQQHQRYVQSHPHLQDPMYLQRASDSNDYKSALSELTSRDATPHSQDGHHNSNGNSMATATHNLNRSQAANGQPVMNHSCEECKRRKVKCDRQVPCGACVRRNRADQCRIESDKPKPQQKKVYALDMDVKRLSRRLAEVEKLLKIKPHVSSSSFASPSGHHQHHGTGDESMTSTPHGPTPHHSGDEYEDGDMASDEGQALEQAATRLEVAAYNTRPTGTNYRASDSLPFFDNTVEYKRTPGKRSRSLSGTPPSDPELTSAGTSILAPNTEILWSAAPEMGLDPFLTGPEIAQAQKEAIKRVLTVLPTKQDSIGAINLYFSEVDWVVQATTRTAFIPEHERFWQMVEQGRATEVDCLWLATYFLILAVAQSSLKTIRAGSKFPFSTCPSATMGYAAARRLLHLGDWSAKPRVRTIQAVLLMSQYVQTSSQPGEASRLFMWIAGGVRVAHALGLHQLGDDPEIMPLDDSAWPPGKNARKRQAAIRLFSSLRLLELSTAQRFRAALITPAHTTTGLVANVDFESLSMTDWKFEEQSPHVLTDATFEFVKSKMCALSLVAWETLSAHPRHVPYERILEIDDMYAEVLDDLPPQWRLPLPKGTKRGSPETRWKRHAVQEVLNNRRVKLHRPYFARGLQTDSPYHRSKEQCVKSARIVIQSHHDILDVTNSVWFSYSHTLTAALVLFADLFHAIDSGMSDKDLDKMSTELVMAYTIFSRYEDIASSILRNVAQQGAKVISGLFMAEKKRRQLRDTGAASPPEPFAKILQQITHELDAPVPRHQLQLGGAQPGVSSALGLNTSSTPVISLQSEGSTNINSNSTSMVGNENNGVNTFASAPQIYPPTTSNGVTYWPNNTLLTNTQNSSIPIVSTSSTGYNVLPPTSIPSNQTNFNLGSNPINDNPLTMTTTTTTGSNSLGTGFTGGDNMVDTLDWSWLDLSGSSGMVALGLDGSTFVDQGNEMNNLLSGW